MDNKAVFSKNLKHYVRESGKARQEICAAINEPYSTFSAWINGKKIPHIDKIEKLAAYFGVTKSHLIEERLTAEQEAKSDAIADITMRMKTDPDFFDLVQLLYTKDSARIRSLIEMLRTFS